MIIGNFRFKAVEIRKNKSFGADSAQHRTYDNFMPKKILVVLTSVEKYPNLNRATGLWLREAVHFVKKVEEAGYEVDYVSPKGDYTPIDPHSLAMADAIDWEGRQCRDLVVKLLISDQF